MLSYQVREYYEFLNNKFKEFEPNINIILEFGDKYKTNTTFTLKKVIGTNITPTGTDGTHYVVKGGGIQEGFKSVIKEFKSNFNFFEVFSQYTTFKGNIIMYLKKNTIDDTSIIEFFRNVDSFFKLYQAFMQSDNDVELALDFGQCVKETTTLYITLKQVYYGIENNLYDNIENTKEENFAQINIQLLSVEYNFEEFTKKLNIINEIYCELGNMIYKDKSFEKLKIVKIESGSLLSIILGDKNIIESISILINKSVNLVFNKFTYEGKITRHTEFRNELISDTDLIEKMKVFGYDVTDAKENNQESLTILTRDLLKLSKSSAKIKIDDKEYNIKEEMKVNFLESATTLTLNSRDDEV